MNLYNSEVVSPANVIRELKQYFVLRDPGIRDADGNVLINLTKPYFYPMDGDMFPIPEPIYWNGDYHDMHGNLVCTATQKAVALRLVKDNYNDIVEYGDYSGSLSDAMVILSVALMDYYCSVRAFNVSDNWKVSRSYLTPEIAAIVENDPVQFDNYISKMINILDVALPGSVNALSELGSDENTAYSVVTVHHVGNYLTISKTGDWRIEEWKRMTAEQKEQKAEMRERPEAIDPGRMPDDIIEAAIARRARVEKAPALPTNKHLTVFHRL